MSVFDESKDRKSRQSRKTLRHNDDVAVAINKLVASLGTLPPAILFYFFKLSLFSLRPFLFLFYYYPPSSGIASCVGTAGTVT